MTPGTRSGVCHVCGRTLYLEWAKARDVEYASTNDTFTYYLCEACDALSIHPLPIDRLAEIYPSTYYSFASAEDQPLSRSGAVTGIKAWLDRRRFRRILQTVASPRPRILDVGGGTGKVSADLVAASEGAATATVIDFDPGSVEAAKSRGLEVYLGRFEDYETDERFDIVMMLNVLEHVSDPFGMLEKSHRLLAPRGILWLQTPNFRSLDARIFRHRNWGGLHCPRHWTIFSTAGLRAALERADLEAESLERTQGAAFWASSLLGLSRRESNFDELPTPIVEYRSFLPLAAAAAAFDFTTRYVRDTSQVVVLARAGSANAA
ncbi:MAG: class I SAM-dependent methyltransferase [Actinomycetota bacterium]|nr:class I SAM-dependent methyltransferase [Actinomycetota bacterium]